MNGQARRILKSVARRGEMSLGEVIHSAKRKHGSHLDQYPLALLIEENYLGMTLSHTPPEGAGEMREFSLATTFHMFGLPKEQDGAVHYMGIVSRGSVDPEKERVFIKAKGALYLDEQSEKRWDRAYSFVFGLLAGFIAAFGSGWLLDYLTSSGAYVSSSHAVIAASLSATKYSQTSSTYASNHSLESSNWVV